MLPGNHRFGATPSRRPRGTDGAGSRRALHLLRRCLVVLSIAAVASGRWRRSSPSSDAPALAVGAFSPSPPPSTGGRRGATRAKTRNGGLVPGASLVRQRGGTGTLPSTVAFTSLRGGGDETSAGSSSGEAGGVRATDLEAQMPAEAAAAGVAGTAETLTTAATATTKESVGTGAGGVATTAANSRNRARGPPPGFLRKTFPNLHWHRLPDYLTYARCAAIPLLAFVFYHPKGPAAQTYRNVETALLFGFASFTDWLDGYLARRWECSTAFGAFLDPVADKLMVSTALVLLSGRYGAAVALPSAVILAREIAVSALREWMAKRDVGDAVKVGWQGKCKTALTMVAVTVLLFVPYPPEAAVSGKGGGGLGAMCLRPGLALLYASALLTVTSGSVYFRAAAPVLLERDD